MVLPVVLMNIIMLRLYATTNKYDSVMTNLNKLDKPQHDADTLM